MTSLQTWEIRAEKGKDGKRSSFGFRAVWKRLVKSFSAVARSPRQQVPSPMCLDPVMSVG